jgi:PAS domain S-box-containing protein
MHFRKKTFIRLLVQTLAGFALLAPGGTLSADNSDSSLTHSLNPEIIIRGDMHNPPFEYLDGEQPRGFDIDLIRAVCEVMNLSYRIHLGPWPEVRSDVENNRFDLVCGMSYSAERDLRADFSVPYLMITSDIFIRKNSPVRSLKDMRHKEVIVQEGFQLHDILLAENIADSIITVSDASTALRLLASGKHDCALLTKIQGMYLVQKLGLTNIVAAGAKMNPVRCCFAVKNGDALLLGKLNEGLNIIQVSGRYQEIHEKWFGIYKTQIFMQNLSYLFFALALGAAIFFAILLWNQSLRKQVRNQTAEIRQIIDLVPHLIFAKDWEGRFLLVNKAMADSYGLTVEQLIGKKHIDVHPAHDEVVKFLIDDHEVMKSEQVKFISEESYHDAKGARHIFEAIKIPFITSRTKKPAILGIAIDITELKEKESAFTSSEDKFTTSFMASPDLFIISTFPEGNIIDVNDNFLQRMGFKRDEVIGKFARDLKIWVNLRDRSHFIHSLRESGRCTNMETKFRTRSGEVLIIQISARPIQIGGRPCTISIARDITQQKTVEIQLKKLNKELERRVESRTAQLTKINEELQREINERKRTELERDYFATILEYTKDLAVIKDLDRRIIAANHAYLSAAGLKHPGDVIGRTESEIFDNTSNAQQKWESEKDDLRAQKLKLNEAVVREERLIYPDGQARYLLIRTFAVFNRRGKVIGTASTSSDITDIKNAETELKKINDDLEQRVAERTGSMLEEIRVRRQAEEEVRKLNEELEKRVRARTTELQQTNQSLKDALTRLQEDEEAGREIQRQLLPERVRFFNGIEYSCHLIPSMYLSGDFTDYFAIDENYTAFYVADVSGHGTSSAFITVLLKSYMDQYLKKYLYQEDRIILDPARIMTILNNELLEKKIDKYLTIFYGIIDRSGNKLIYSNGGQFPFPVFLEGKTPRFLKEGNMPIGLFESATYDSFQVDLPGEFCILIISDGILEILPQDSIRGKEDYLLALLNRDEIYLEAILDSLNIQQATALPDDITFTLVKRMSGKTASNPAE